MELIFITVCASVFVFALVAVIASIFMREKIRMESRLNRISANHDVQIRVERKRNNTSFINNISWLFHGEVIKKVSNDLALAAVPLRAEEFIIIWLMTSLGPASLIALFKFNIFVCAALIAAGLLIPPIILGSAKKKRMALFDKQLGDALSIMGNCLRAGFSFNQALESISTEMPDPVAKEFFKVTREIRLGLAMEKALMNMVERLENKDLELIVSAVLIQRQVGGNLSEILDSIAETIKERLNLKGEIRVLTATGRTSGIVVGMLPVFLMGVLMLINPGYVSMFFNTPIGIAMLIVGAILETIGFLFVKKIVDIKF